MSNSSRNASITPRKIATKVTTNASPENNQENPKNGKSNKNYLPSSKIQRNKIFKGGMKLSNKHTLVKDGIIRTSSGSNRDNFTSEANDKMNVTSSKTNMDKDNYKKSNNEFGHSEIHKIAASGQDETSESSMPMVIQNRPSSNIYGKGKSQEDKGQKFTSLMKSKDKAGYNAHPHLWKKGNANRNILKAKMEIRTHNDSQGDEYNLILKSEQHNMMNPISGKFKYILIHNIFYCKN